MGSETIPCRVAAMVTTYNRKDLLRCNLRALIDQTRPLDEIIVIDNVSTDGTDIMLSAEFPQLTYIRMEKNVGSAGGVYEGIKRAYEQGYDWVWVMDDDTVPDANALQRLLTACLIVSEEVGFLCSHVVWTDGAPHKMNIPRPKQGDFSAYADQGLIGVTRCSFVSVLFSHVAISKVGLPIREMFIYGDDWEYTERVAHLYPCYFVPASRAVHVTKLNIGADIEHIPAEQMWKCYYDARNKLYIHRQSGVKGILRYLATLGPRDLIKAARRRRNRFAALSLYVKGMAAGLWFSPRITRL